MNINSIIVSCTTTKSRIHMLFYMIESLKKQKLLPDRLYVNLSSEPYLTDEGISELPDWIHQKFINVNWTENIGPYRKLIPIIEEVNEDDLIITADDDILFDPSWLENLVEFSKKYPNHLVCSRARNMKKNKFNRWQNYNKWNLISSPKEGLYILPTGGAGAVYRKSLLDLEFLLDPTFKNLAPQNDDLWFRMASLRKSVPAYVFPQINKKNIYLKHNKGLERYNLPQKRTKFIHKIYAYTVGNIRDWFGKDSTNNDHSWSSILDYSPLSQ